MCRVEQAFMEVQTQMVAIAQQQAGVESQIEAKKMENRRLEITLQEVDALPADTRCYSAVGRM